MTPGNRGPLSRSTAFVLSALYVVAAFGNDVVGPHGVLRSLDRLEDRPVWPEQYAISWQIDIPYVKELQKEGLTYHYKVWQDTKNGRQKTTRDGVESVVEFIANNTMYQIYPRIDTWGCRNLEINGGGGPTRRLLAGSGPQLTLVLPDLTEDRWKFNSSATIEDGPHKGSDARAYSWIVTKDEGYGEVTATYTFYVAKDNTPLRLFMWGKNLYTGGHYDAYIVDYSDYKPGEAPEDTWAVPDFCPKEPEPSNAASQQRHWLSKLRSVMPSTHYGDRQYDAFTHHFGRRHSSRSEYASRKQLFYQNKAMIEGHNSNATGSSHRLAVNQFADWAHEEYVAVMLPNRGHPRPQLWASGQPRHVHNATVPHHMLPATVDWRGTGADSPVKDQAMCGSCWAFGAVGSLEAAYFRETGKQLLMSEQMLLDCAWNEGDDNKACMGGFQNLAYQWLLPRGAMASEADYPYEGVTNFCRKDAPLAAKFTNAKYVEVKGGEKALMEALYTKGPMTVSVDAEPDSFTFYSSGVYTNSKCQTDIDKLDHAVIVSGYGTTEDGQDYWLVKNTWSTNWGEEGYLRIARQPDDCGIATQPIYVDFDVLE